ncbi:MAG: alanine--tRNA ligase [Clostridiales bacterium]|nr:alanine--tRNA ligase [Clostridiales bacterium]
MITGSEIRKKFLDFFAERGHTVVPSSSLVPYNDQTLLFTNAGMVQFKDVFLGLEQKPFQRAVTAQRCLRAGGKHNDLETVGRTARHQTFFEMLGNFSFGDYFKADAIRYAWEFLTVTLGLDKEKLYVTVYDQDEEARELWQSLTGIEPSRIFGIGGKDNFWSMGDTGPCGPCSEIFVDRGEKYCCQAEVCAIGHCDCDRWMEIWNLVFMQYNRDEAGNLTPLPKPSIDTGMGLERITSVLQEVDSNYDTDLLKGLIQAVEELCGKPYSPGPAGFPFRVIADHARACSFLIADGVMPSNEGRGYVLRRILRRAARFGRALGLEEPFLYKLAPSAQRSLGEAAPELTRQMETVRKILRAEEERFADTLQYGLAVAAEMIKKLLSAKEKFFKREDAFLLYDTYGFPLDLTKDIAEEYGLSVDTEGFNRAMEEQRARARAARQKADTWEETVNMAQLFSGLPVSVFHGYEQNSVKGKALALFCGGQLVEEISGECRGYIALDRTVFYAEGGGQAADQGAIRTKNALLQISDALKLANGVVLHKFTLEEGSVRLGEEAEALIDTQRRRDIERNHTATHLLHKALRSRLGEHLHQAGSQVLPERLRFDFTHFAPLSVADLAALEEEINEQIMADLPVSAQAMRLEEAKQSGALAFFDGKYGENVRVVALGDYSRELCGGTHCHAAGQIGSVKLLSEAGIGVGIRRIEAVTGRFALRYYRENEETLEKISHILKTEPAALLKKTEALQSENKALAKELEKLKMQQTKDKIEVLSAARVKMAGIPVLLAEVEAGDMEALRRTMDLLWERQQGVILLAAKAEDKVNIMVKVSGEGQKAGLHAGNLAKEAAAACGGGGGGKADMAQAGGKNAEKIPEALAAAGLVIKRILCE